MMMISPSKMHAKTTGISQAGRCQSLERGARACRRCGMGLPPGPVNASGGSGGPDSDPGTPPPRSHSRRGR